jgi:hypothetical protein
MIDEKKFLNQILEKKKIEKNEKKNEIIQILWDCSFSNELSNNKKNDIELLNGIINNLKEKPKKIIFTTFSFESFDSIEVEFKDFNKIIEKLNQIYYDGGTNLSVLSDEEVINENADYILVFTDG